MNTSKVIAASILAAGALASGGILAAQPAADEARTIYSAGHKALFMCSGVFVAGRTPDQIRANEFAYAADSFNAPGDAAPDYKTKTAVGTDASGRIKRRAAFRKGLGCTLMAPDATLADVAKLPKASVPRAPGNPAKIAWPDGDLVTKAPLPPEVDRAKLDAAMDRMFDGKSYADPAAMPKKPGAPTDMKTIGALVVYKGRIIAERYSDGWGPHTQGRTYSAAKSIASSLLAIRIRQGAFNVDSPANFPEWKDGDPRRKITLRHFLNMSSGLQCEGEAANTEKTYFGGGVDAGAVAANRPLEVEPGTRWCYSNFDTISLGRAVRLSLKSDEDYLTFPHRELFMKIGMRDTYPETDAFGNFIISSQIWTTPRDLARFGLLYLRDGVWNGERILPQGWTEFVRTPAPALVTSSGPNPRGYGGQFWLFASHPRIPKDTYSAIGHGGTYSTIIPSKDLVIVRLGLREVRYQDFVADVVDAISAPASS